MNIYSTVPDLYTQVPSVVLPLIYDYYYTAVTDYYTLRTGAKFFLLPPTRAFVATPFIAV